MEEEATICIIDTQNAAERDPENALLLWTACLFSPKIAAACWAASMMYIPVRFNHLSETQKFKMYYNALSKAKNTTPDLLQGMQRAFDFIQTHKKRNGKTKEQIIILRQMEKKIGNAFNFYRESYVKMLDTLKLSALLPLTDPNTTHEPQKPLSIWSLPENDSPEHAKWNVNLFADLMCYPERLPMLEAESITPHANFLELTNLHLHLADNSNTILCQPIIEFPEPLTLTANQMQLVRSNLITTSRKLMQQLCTLKEQFQKIPFTENNFSSIAALYKENTDALKSEVQQAINQDQYLNQLNTETEEIKTCKLWMGMSTFNTVFYLYRQLTIIDLSTEAYAKEEAAQTIQLDNTCLFLFLELIEK